MDNKIRIGNDVRLVMTITTNLLAGFDTISNFDSSNVKQLRCYLINTSFAKLMLEEDKKFRRVGFPQFYQPTKYNINNSGYPSYHMMPANVCNYNAFSPDFHDYHWWPGYRGFGVYPERFYACEKHINDNYRTNPIDIFGAGTDSISSMYVNEPVYLADSQVLPEQNKITCLFPAVQQLMCGTYKLVIVLTVFEQGWGRHNLRTYTIDKGDVFELVNDYTGKAGDITINIDSEDRIGGQISEIYTDTYQYEFAENTSVPFGKLDLNDSEYNIYVTLKDGSTALYNPYDWHFDRLNFTSSNEDLVQISKTGLITIGQISGVEDQSVNIVVYSEDSLVEYTFKIVVKKLDRIKIGFSNKQVMELMSYNDPSLVSYDALSSVFNTTNYSDGKYMWILSQREIKDIAFVSGLEAIDSDDRAFTIGVVDGYFCYKSHSTFSLSNVGIKITFA